MATCMEGKSLSTFDYSPCGLLVPQPPAEMQTFVPSMVSMLTDRLPTLGDDRVADGVGTFHNDNDDSERSRVGLESLASRLSPFHVGQEAKAMVRSPTDMPNHRTGESFGIPSAHVPLPDINSFIQNSKNFSMDADSSEGLMSSSENAESIFSNLSSKGSSTSLHSIALDSGVPVDLSPDPETNDSGTITFADLSTSQSGSKPVTTFQDYKGTEYFNPNHYKEYHIYLPGSPCHGEQNYDAYSSESDKLCERDRDEHGGTMRELKREDALSGTYMEILKSEEIKNSNEYESSYCESDQTRQEHCEQQYPHCKRNFALNGKSTANVKLERNTPNSPPAQSPETLAFSFPVNQKRHDSETSPRYEQNLQSPLDESPYAEHHFELGFGREGEMEQLPQHGNITHCHTQFHQTQFQDALKLTESEFLRKGKLEICDNVDQMQHGMDYKIEGSPENCGGCYPSQGYVDFEPARLNGSVYPRPHHNPYAQLVSCHDFENLVGPCMEEMKKIILKEVVKDVDTACSTLGLSPDPHAWSEEDVGKWVIWTMNQYNLPFFNLSLFRMNGRQLCSLTEAEMRSRAPRCGDILYAHLEIWKTVVETTNKDYPDDLATDMTEQAFSHKIGDKRRDVVNSIRLPAKRIKTKGDVPCCNDYLKLEALASPGKMNQMLETDATCLSSRTDAHESTLLGRVVHDESCVTVMTPNHTAGIHLWQFLKELLLQPQAYGQYIRWIDKDHGIFKIEDSVEVARLWGIRKNRPAMNYDKLSRSIRQYYKKGIIKKTEVSQRLVYQFVKPVV